MAKEKFTLDTTQAIKSLERLAGSVKTMNDRVKEHNSLTKKQNQETDRLNKRMEAFRQSVNTTNRALQRSANMLSGQATAMRNITTAARGVVTHMGRVAQGAARISVALNQVAASNNSFIRSSSACIRNIDRMNQNVQRSVVELRGLNVELKKKIQDLSAFAGSLARTSTRLVQAARATQQTRHEVRLFGVDFKSAAHVIFATNVHRFWLQLLQEIRDSSNAARELSIRIGEIRSISLGTSLATEEWQRQLRAVSDAFGLDLLDTAEGAYQALSNQVVKAKESMAFMAQEAKLAILTVTSLANAVEATTSILNAWNLGSERASEVNAILFKAVEVGRFRLDEIANNLGRVSVLSSELGVSFLEQTAALTLMTRQGLTAERAITLLENVERALIKPTKEMNEIFDQWGVTSGENAVATFGLVGTLAKLRDIANSSGDAATAMAEQFGDFRSILGALSLSTKEYNEELRKFGGAGKDAAAGFKEIMDTIGQQLTREFTKAKNFFTVEIGTRLNNALLKFLQSLGGADKALRGLFTVLKHGTTLLISYKIAVAVMTPTTLRWHNATRLQAVALLLLHGKIRAAIAALRGLQVAKAAATFGITLLIDGLIHLAFQSKATAADLEIAGDALASELGEKGRKTFEDLSIVVNDAFGTMNIAFDNLTRDYNQMLANVRAQNNRLSVDFDKNFKKIGDAITKGLKEPLKEIEDRISKLKRDYEEFSREAESRAKDVREEEFESTEKAFRHDISGLPELEQLTRLNEAKEELHRRSIEAVERGDIEAFDFLKRKVNEIHEEIQERLKKLHEEASKPIDIKEEVVTREVDPLTGRRRTKRSKVKVGERPKDEDMALKLLEQINLAEERRRQLKADQLELDKRIIALKEGEALRAKEEAEALEKSFAAFKELVSELDAFDTEEPDALGRFRDLVGRVDEGAAGLGLSLEARLDLFRKAKAQELELEKKINLEAARARLDALQKELDQGTDKFKAALAERQAAVTNFNQQLTGLGEKLGKPLGVLREFMDPQFLEFPFPQEQAVIDRVKGLISALNELSEDATPENLQSVRRQLEELNKAKDALLKLTLTYETTTDKPRPEVAAKFRAQMGQIHKTLEIVNEAFSEVNAAQERLSKSLAEEGNLEAQIQALNQQFINTVTATQQSGEAYDTLRATLVLLRQELERIVDLQNQIEAMGGGAIGGVNGGVGGGGLFAHGGRVGVGTDRIPAMLSPREVVVNAAGARYISPMLSMLNRLPPMARDSQGGNTTFGDIHIHTSEGTSAMQGEEIARYLQRRVRKGLRG